MRFVKKRLQDINSFLMLFVLTLEYNQLLFKNEPQNSNLFVGKLKSGNHGSTPTQTYDRGVSCSDLHVSK